MIAERLALRPRKLTAIADFALHFSRVNAAALAIPVLLCALPAAAVAHWLSGDFPFGAWCLLAASARLASSPLTLACADLAVQPTTSLQTNLVRTVGRLPTLLALLAIDATLRCLTLGLSAALVQFSNEVILLERGSVGAAIARSRKLLAAAPGRTMAMLGLAIGLPVWGAFGGELGYAALLDVWAVPHKETGLVDHGVTLAALLGAGLAEAGWTIVRFLAYLDCRTRNEGWDLQLQCQAWVERQQAGTAVRAG